MDFIETLRSVGGVKPCWQCSTPQPTPPGKRITVTCFCRGTGQILDLAPLLAKPKVLGEDCARILCNKLYNKQDTKTPAFDVWKESMNFHIVGPQRAHSLVYEIARQLGGTTVVAEPGYREETLEWDDARGDQIVYCKDGYNLSLPIPSDATVLFVTDRVDEKELLWVFRALTLGRDPLPILPYLLCLIGDGAVAFREPVTLGDSSMWGKHADELPEILKVISLHQEKP